MSSFRAPYYLDVDVLRPLADFHNIEVMTDSEISNRQRMQRGGGAGGSAGASFGPVARVSAEGRGSRESEDETTTSKTIVDSPVTGLNRLLDHLENQSLVKAFGDVLSRRDVVDLEGEWEVSPLTDVARLLTKMLSALGANPGASLEGDIPPELLGAILGSDDGPGTVVMRRVDATKEDPATIVILESQRLVDGFTVDDLEGDRNVFGTVSTLVDEGSNYSLENVLLSGVPRSVRRGFKGNGGVQKLLETPGFGTSDESIEIEGPALVINAIAVY